MVARRTPSVHSYETRKCLVPGQGQWQAIIVHGISRFLRDEEAATAVEYAVILALILTAIIGAIGSVGAQTGGMWSNIQADLRAMSFGN